jgi:putative endonuclease
LSHARREGFTDVTLLLQARAYGARMSTDRRRDRGALGERIAVQHLERRGYEIVVCNARTRHGELDVVAADERALVFCEVKTRVIGGRSGPTGPLDAIGPAKQRRLRALARDWLARTPDRPFRRELRFDAIGVTLTPDDRLVAVEHLEGAF